MTKGLMSKINADRIRQLNDIVYTSGPVLYWMSREQRIENNWALIYAQEIAIKNKSPLYIIFNLVPEFLNATIRQYGFMLKGLQQIEPKVQEKNLVFEILPGDPAEIIPKYIKEKNIKVLVSDFDPLRIKRSWKESVNKNIDISHYEVDAHNIIPCWLASNKKEYSAYTFRIKVHRKLDHYMNRFPPLRKHPFNKHIKRKRINWSKLYDTLNVNMDVGESKKFQPGAKSAHRCLRNFIDHKLDKYSEGRNDPVEDVQSNLSVYLHYGQISAQYIAQEVIASDAQMESKEDFLEELIVRRELADNFCLYNKFYDSVKGFSSWAQLTLGEHLNDEREYIYTQKEFEESMTHDDLWNAAQIQMVNNGKMHGYMRMYWAKKILEWSKSPEDAMKIAIYLNDKYELDGRDPNGYTGIAWSIGGVHDRAWGQRPVFGKIRYMSYAGCKSKFDVDAYINRQMNEQAKEKIGINS
jgi:deoxyribodipyrimidine photo-lyase